MKIKNETHYDTRYLRKLFLACERHEGTGGKGREVNVKPTCRRGVHGKAWIHSRFITMYLPKNANARAVAQVYIHEVGHNLGLRHKDMANLNSIDVTFWPGIGTVKLKEVKPKPKRSLVEVRAAHARKKLTEWEKKFKRAKNIIKKYQRQVKYYDRKMAASPNTESS